MFQFCQENGKYFSRTTNFQQKPLPLARQPGGKRKAPHRRITYLNIPTLQNDLIICESNLERDCALVIALNPEVVRIECQPETIDLGAYGKYTPDFRVIYKSAPPSYVEVKPTIFAYEKKMWAKICVRISDQRDHPFQANDRSFQSERDHLFQNQRDRFCTFL